MVLAKSLWQTNSGQLSVGKLSVIDWLAQTSRAGADGLVVLDLAVGALAADVGVGLTAWILALELDAGLEQGLTGLIECELVFENKTIS